MFTGAQKRLLDQVFNGKSMILKSRQLGTTMTQHRMIEAALNAFKEVAAETKDNSIPPSDPETQALLSEITQRYIQDRDRTAIKEALRPNLLLALMLRNQEAKMADTVKEITGYDKPTESELTRAHVSEVARWPEPGAAPLAEKPPLGPTREVYIFSTLREDEGSLRQAPEIWPTPGVFHASPEAEIPVTDEMIAAAAAMADSYEVLRGDIVDAADDVFYGSIYRAMRRLEPMQSTPGLWSDETVRKLIAERDTLKAELAGAEERVRIVMKHYKNTLAERDEANVRVVSLGAEIAMLRAHPPLTRTPDGNIHVWNPDDGRWEDRGVTVAFPADPPPSHTASDVKPEPKREPKPIPTGALNPPSGDPRRVGG